METKYYIAIFKDGAYSRSYSTESISDALPLLTSRPGISFEVFAYPAMRPIGRKELLILIDEDLTRLKYIAENRPELLPPRPKPKSEPYCRRIRCIETGQVFSNIREASRTMGIPYMTIVNRINKKTPVYELHFEDVKEQKEDTTQ